MKTISKTLLSAALTLAAGLTFAAEQPAEALEEATIPGRFALEDADGDGYLSPQEVDIVRGVDFLDFDLDGDGLLSLEEYARGMELYLSGEEIGDEADAMVLGGEADAAEVMEVEEVEVEEVELDVEVESEDEAEGMTVQEALERAQD